MADHSQLAGSSTAAAVQPFTEQRPPQATDDPLTPPATATTDELGSLLAPDRLAIWSWVLGYTALLTTLSVLRVNLWLATGFDLGLYQQGMWQLLHGGLAAPTTYTGQPILALHASWVLVLLAPLHAIGGLGFLLGLQSFALGLGYYFVRRIASRSGVDAATAHIVGVIYLLCPTVLGSNLFDFHPIVLTVPCLFALVGAGIDRRSLTFFLLLLAAFVVDAESAVVLLGVGLALVLQRRVLLGAAALLVVIVGLYADVHLVLPWLVRVHDTPATLLNVSGSMAAILKQAGTYRAWEYLAWILSPFALVFIPGRLTRHLAWLTWLLPVAVVVALNLASPSPASTSPFDDNSLLAIPFLIATAIGYHRSAPRLGRRHGRAILFLPILAVCTFGVHEGLLSRRSLPPNADELNAAAQLIPPQAPLVAQNSTAAPLSGRRLIYLPEIAAATVLPKGTYILIDPSAHAGLTPATVETAFTQRVALDSSARQIYKKDGVELLRLDAPLGRAEPQDTVRRAAP